MVKQTDILEIESTNGLVQNANKANPYVSSNPCIKEDNFLRWVLQGTLWTVIAQNNETKL